MQSFSLLLVILHDHDGRDRTLVDHDGRDRTLVNHDGRGRTLVDHDGRDGSLVIMTDVTVVLIMAVVW